MKSKTAQILSSSNAKRLLSIGEAAKFLGVSIDTLRNWEEQGKIIPFRASGGIRRYRLTQLKKLQKKEPKLALKNQEEVSILKPIQTTTSIPSTPSSPRHFRHVLVIGIAILAFVSVLTGTITLGYFVKPEATRQFFANQASDIGCQISDVGCDGPESEEVLGVETRRGDGEEGSRAILSAILSPFNQLAQTAIQTLSPVTAKDLGFYQKTTNQRFEENKKSILELDESYKQLSQDLSKQLQQSEEDLNNLQETVSSQISAVGNVLNTTTDNLLKNSSFEANVSGQPDSWFYVNESTSQNTFVNNSSVRSGNHALRIEPKGGKENFGLYQPAAITVTNHTYTLSLYIKSDSIGLNNQTGQTPTLKLSFWDKNNNRKAVSKEFELENVRDWTRYSFTLDPPNQGVDGNGYYPMIEILGATQGNLFLDDIDFSEGTSTPFYAQENILLGDGSITADVNGNLYPTTSRTGSLGLDNFRFNSLYLTKASIDKDGNTSIGGNLSMAGSATVTADLGVDGGDLTSSSSTFNLLNTNVTTLNIGGTATAIGLGASSGTTTINNNLSVTGATTSFSGDLTVTGNDLTFGNGESISNATDGTLSLTSTTLSFSGTTFTASSAAGSFDSLTVGGGYGSTGVSISNDGVIQANGALTIDGTSDLQGNISSSTGNLNLTDTTNIGTDTLFVQNSGNVGIGNTAPQTILHVTYSDSASSTDKGLRISNTDTTANNRINIGFSDTAASGSLFGQIGIKVVDHTGGGQDSSFYVQTRNGGDLSDRLVVDKTGKLGINTDPGAFNVHILPDDTSGQTSLALEGYGIEPNYPVYYGRRARGVVGTPTAVQSGDHLLVLGGRGHDGSAWNGGSSAAILFTAAENFTTSTHGSYIAFETTPTGSTTDSRTEMVRITSGGNVGIGTTVPESSLHVATDIATGKLFEIDWEAAKTQTGALTGALIDFTNVTSDGTNTLYGLHINDQVGATASTEYGIYQQGTNWDYGIYAEDAVYLAGTEGSTIFTLNAGDAAISDGSLAITDDDDASSFSVTNDTITTANLASVASSSLTSGTALALSSTATSFNGELLTLSKTGASGSTAFTSDIANITYSQTFNGGVGLDSTGNVLDISRNITLNNAGNIHTISGALVSIADTMTQTDGTLTHTASVLDITQNYTTSTGTALYVKSYGGDTGLAFRVDDGSGDTSPFIINNLGNVGIGTTAPTQKLDVAGNITLSAGSDILAQGDGSDIGTSGTKFDKIYANEVNATTLVGTLSAGNLTASTFTINSDYTGADAENSDIAFERGSETPNALIAWDATAKEFDLNSQVHLTGTITSTSGIILGGFTTDVTTAAGEALNLNPATLTTDSGTGGALVLAGGNESGATSTGGAVSINAGTGTSTNGAINIANTVASSIGIGAAAGSTLSLGNTTGTFAVTGTTLGFTANGTGNDITFNLVDSNTDALDIQEGTNNYININTTNSSENISFGNASTNPTYSFLGTGGATIAGNAEGTAALTLTKGDIIVSDGDLTLSGGDFSFTGATGVISLSSTLDIDALGTTLDATTLSIDSTDTTNFTMTANNAADKTMTIAATNSDGTGKGLITVSSEGDLSLDTSAGTLYLNNTNNQAINTGTGTFTVDGAVTFNTDVDFTLAGNENMTIANTTNTLGASGMLDLASTSSTTDTRTLDISTTFSSTGAATSYGLYNTWASSAVVTGVDVSQTAYGLYNTATKTGADDATGTLALYGTYSTASNTGSTDAGTKNTYGGYFTATGDTAGTSTAYGLYTSASGADSNFALYSNAGVNYFGGNVGIGTTIPNRKLHVIGDVSIVGDDDWNGVGDMAILNFGGVANEGIGVGYEFGKGLVFDVFKSGSTSKSGSNGLDAMFIQETSGNVGIGTTVPESSLHVATDIATGKLFEIDWEAAKTQTGALTGALIDFTNVTSDGTNTLYGLHINDQVGATASTEYGIYQQGTNWDYGIYAEDAVSFTSTLNVDSSSTLNGVTLDANSNFAMSSGTGTFTQTFSGDTTDAMTITAASLTTGSALVLTGPSGGTAGVTDATLKIASDIGNTGTANGLVSSTATIDSTAAAANGVNLYLATTNSNSTEANSAYGMYNTLSDAVALANTNYGSYTTVSNTGAIDSAITKTIYGSYILASGTGGAPTTAGTTNVYGQYLKSTATNAADFGTVNNYGLYIDNGTSSTNGTSSKYGLYIVDQTGADTNYGVYSAGTTNVNYFGGNVGIGTTVPAAKLDVLGGEMFLGGDHSTWTARTNATAKSAYITLPHYTNSEEHIELLESYSSNTDSYLALGGGSSSYNAVKELIFFTAANTTTTTGTERMRIDSGGNIGFATTAPDAALEINHASGDSLRLTYGDSNGSAANYTDFSLSTTGALTLTGSAATLAASATAEKTFLTLTPGTVTLTAPTGVTSLMETAALTGATLAADAGTTVDKATTLSLVAPIDSTNVTLTASSALRLLNVTSGTGTLTSQYGLFVEDMTAGTNDYGVYIAGADSYALYTADDPVAFVLGADDSVSIDAAATDSTGTSGVLDIDLDTTASQAGIDLNVETITDAGVDTVSGLKLTATATSTDADVIYGVHVANLGGTPTAGNEYGIYQAGTSWDYGIYAEDAAYFGSTITSIGNLTVNKADPSVIFDTTTATDTDFWMGVQEDAGGDDDDRFMVGDGTTPGTNPFLTITTGGNVGIGTTAPNHPLHVVGVSSFGAAVTSNSYVFAPTTGNKQVWLTSNTDQAVNTGSVLVLAGKDRASDDRQTAFGSIAGLKENSTNSNIDGFLSFYTSNETAGASGERMRITSGGNIGFATTAPDAALEINHASGDSLRLTYGDSNGSAANYTDFSLSTTGALTLTGSNATLADGATAEKTYLTLTPGTTTLTGPTQVTSLMETSVITGATIAATNATTINRATGLSVSAPVDSTNATITTSSAITALDTSSGAGTLTNLAGIYVEPMTGGASGNYGICFDCDGTWTSSTVAAGIQFGTDANAVTLYRSASDTLRTGDNLTVDLDLTVSGGDITGANGESIDIGEANGTISFLIDSTSGLNVGSTGISSIGNVAHTIVNSSGALNIDSNSTGAINIGTGANAKTITIGNNTSTTALAFTSGTGSQTFTSSVVSTTGTSSAFVFNDAALTSGTLMYLQAAAVTSGKLFDVNTGSSIFSISNTDVTTSLPTSFTAAGDVSMAYDLNMTNPTASYIKSAAPLYINAGETFNSSDLNLGTYNQGSIILSQTNNPTAAATSYAVQILPTLTSSTNSMTYTSLYGTYNVPTVNLSGDAATDLTTLYGNYTGLTATAGTIGTWFGNYIAAPTGSGTVSAKNALVIEPSAGNVGIGTTAPDYLLELNDNTNTPTFGLSDDDIGHGVTTVAQTDSFFHLSSISTTDGGAYLQGLADNVAGATALQLRGIQNSDPTDTVPAIKLIGAKANGTGVQDLAAAETIFQVANNDDTAAFTIRGNGTAGFGTATPAGTVDIITTGLDNAANLYMSGTGNTNASLIELRDSDTVGNWQIVNRSGDSNKLQFYFYNGSWQPNAFTVDGANARVGIRATSPRTILDLGDVDLGDGAAGGVLTLGRNTNGTNTGAGSINFLSKAGTAGYVWQDAAGNMRINTAAPTNANDLAGTVIGAQSSSLDTKNILGQFTDYENALNTILNTELYNFTYNSGSFNNQEFTGIVTDYSPTFGMDRDAAHPGGKSLNLVTGFGYVIGAIKQQQTLINSQISQFSSLTVSEDGTLNAPIISAGKILIPADLATNGLDVNANDGSLVYISSTDTGGNTSYALDVAATLRTIDQRLAEANAQIQDLALQGETLSAQQASQSAQLANLEASSSAALAALQANIASQSGVIASVSEAISGIATDSASLRDDVNALRLTSPDILLATGSATLANLTVASQASISGQLVAYDLSVQNIFRSLGETFLGTTTIAGDLSVDGTMSLTGSSLSTVGNLNFQNGPLAGTVDFFNGLVTINNTGALTAQEITTNKLTISNSSEVLGSSIGSGTIPTGQNMVTINTTAVTATSKIFITSKTVTDKVLAVQNISANSSFDVMIASPAGSDISFNWWIVEVQ